MKKILLFTTFAAGSLVLAGCGDDKPAPVKRETRVVHRYHSSDRASRPANDPVDFEPVERPATYSR